MHDSILTSNPIIDKLQAEINVKSFFSGSLTNHARKTIAIEATCRAHKKALPHMPQARHHDILKAHIFGYDNDGDFSIRTINLPKGNVQQRINGIGNMFDVKGSGANAIVYLTNILRNKDARTKLIDLIKAKVEGEELKRDFMQIIKQFSSKTGFDFIHDLSLETQRKYLEVLMKLVIFTDHNANSLLGSFKNRGSIGGRVRTIAFNPDKPLSFN